MPLVARLHALPQLGAQVWIEPGQTREQIEHWFTVLEESHMPLARLFVQWNFIEPQPGQWDFKLYDWAFDAAAQHHVKIVATLTSNQGPAFVDHGYAYQIQRKPLPENENQLAQADDYVRRTVERYRMHPALDSWMLMNEPSYDEFNGPLGLKYFRGWIADLYGRQIRALNAAWATAFGSFDEIKFDPLWTNPGSAFMSQQSYYDWQRFRVWFLTWQMQHIAEQIRASDSQHPLHVNPHNVIASLHFYDLPHWRTFLDSIGASIHPTHHFGFLERTQFALGVSATCTLIRDSFEPKPFWVTELSGGINTYSGGRPICPSPADIDQWVWTSVGTGAERIIYWCLNFRAQGKEAGEWSLLDTMGNPSERLTESARIARTIEDHVDFFAHARPVRSGVTILLSPESMFLQMHKGAMSKSNTTSDPMAHAKAFLACYESLTELGLTPELKYIDDFDWTATGGTKFLILPHAPALTRVQIEKMKAFVARGNRLFIDGFSGMFDENERNTLYTGFDLGALVGGAIKDIRYAGDRFAVPLRSTTGEALPATTWECEISPTTGVPMAEKDGRVLAVRNPVGRGEVIWIPQPISLQTWTADDGALGRWLGAEVASNGNGQAIQFARQARGCLMQLLTDGSRYVTVVVNQGKTPVKLGFKTTVALTPTMLFGRSDALLDGPWSLALRPEETVVLLWR